MARLHEKQAPTGWERLHFLDFWKAPKSPTAASSFPPRTYQIKRQHLLFPPETTLGRSIHPAYSTCPEEQEPVDVDALTANGAETSRPDLSGYTRAGQF